MKKRIAGLFVIALGTLCWACNKTESNQADTVDTAAPVAPPAEVGEGLSEVEVKALLREEKVNAGNGIFEKDVDAELALIEKEILDDINGVSTGGGADAAPKPTMDLTAKSTFTVENASSKTEYERDMAVMKAIRAYVEQKKKKEAEAAAATDTAANAPAPTTTK